MSRILYEKTLTIQQDVVLIHGWMANRQLWADWAMQGFQDHRVTLIALPGHGDSPALNLADATNTDDLISAWQSAILSQMPDNAILIGWSLGGLLAQKIALDHPDRVSALILLASSPCFVQRDDWTHALDQTAFARYERDIIQDPQGLFRAFSMLASLGSPKPKSTYQQLLAQVSAHPADHAALAQGLRLLKELDLRKELANIHAPTLWLLAEQDAIVPHTLLRELAQYHPQASLGSIAAAGHLPFLTAPEATQSRIHAFLTQTFC